MAGGIEGVVGMADTMESVSISGKYGYLSKVLGFDRVNSLEAWQMLASS